MHTFIQKAVNKGYSVCGTKLPLNKASSHAHSPFGSRWIFARSCLPYLFPYIMLLLQNAHWVCSLEPCRFRGVGCRWRLFLSTGTHRSLMTIHLGSIRRSLPENWNSHAIWISMSSKLQTLGQSLITPKIDNCVWYINIQCLYLCVSCYFPLIMTVTTASIKRQAFIQAAVREEIIALVPQNRYTFI